jgi:hypothetical protein
MLLLLSEAATYDQIVQMLADWETFNKVVVDTRRGILTGGGEMPPTDVISRVWLTEGLLLPPSL